MTKAQLGYPEQALAGIRQALSVAHQLGHTATIAHARSHACVLHDLIGDNAGASEQAVALRSFCNEQRLHYPFWVTTASMFRGAEHFAGNHTEEGLACMVQAVHHYQACGARTCLGNLMELVSPSFPQLRLIL